MFSFLPLNVTKAISILDNPLPSHKLCWLSDRFTLACALCPHLIVLLRSPICRRRSFYLPCFYLSYGFYLLSPNISLAF